MMKCQSKANDLYILFDLVSGNNVSFILKGDKTVTEGDFVNTYHFIRVDC